MLKDKKTIRFNKIEQEIIRLLFYNKEFSTEWFFGCSGINDRLKLSGQEFDAIIESLITKKVLVKNKIMKGYELCVTI